MTIVAAVIVVAITGLLGAAILVVASNLMAVEVDERVDQLLEVLPGANCGACGHPGCAAYAEALTQGAPTNLCVPGGVETAQNIANILGVTAEAVVARKAIVACNGTIEHTQPQYSYSGVATCAANILLHGGSSTCPYGCLGFGDCVKACKFDAIEVVSGVAHVNPEKCTGCGACEEACPKRVIWIREVSEKPVVMCANHNRPAEMRKQCTAGCIGCGKCAKVCPEDAIHVVNNVARIDLDKCSGCRACVNSCPVKAIAIPKVV